MADVEAKKRVEKSIKDTVMPLAEQAFAGIVKAVPELAKTMKKVEVAIKEGDSSDTLLTYRRELVIKMRAVSDARGYAVDALEALQTLVEKDDDFEADSDEIEKLQTKLAKSRDLLAAQIVKGKDLEDKAKAAANKADNSEKTAHAEWDVLISQYEMQTALAKKLTERMAAGQRDAEAAVKARDAAALKEAKAAVGRIILDDDVLQGKMLYKRTNEFMSKYDLDNFSKEFLGEMGRDRATTVVEYDKASQAVEQAQKRIQQAVAKLEIAPPDAVKATAVLGFKANFTAKVEAALKLGPDKLAKALEDIAKQAGVKASGKDLVDKLKKAKLL
jgi:hypothetical protein